MKTHRRKQSRDTHRGEIKEMSEDSIKERQRPLKETDSVVGGDSSAQTRYKERETEIVKKDTGLVNSSQLSFQLTVSINCQPREEVILGS